MNKQQANVKDYTDKLVAAIVFGVKWRGITYLTPLGEKAGQNEHIPTC